MTYQSDHLEWATSSLDGLATAAETVVIAWPQGAVNGELIEALRVACESARETLEAVEEPT